MVWVERGEYGERAGGEGGGAGDGQAGQHPGAGVTHQQWHNVTLFLFVFLGLLAKMKTLYNL